MFCLLLLQTFTGLTTSRFCVLNIYSTYCVCFTMAKHLVKVRNKFFVCWKTPVSFIHLMQCCSILMAINLEFIAHVAIKTFLKCSKVSFSNFNMIHAFSLHICYFKMISFNSYFHARILSLRRL